MKKKTASEIFGTFLPYPKITSVILESGGTPSPSKNPHIIEVHETAADLPIHQGGISGLKTKVTISLRDVLDSNGLTAFIDKEQITKLLKLIVIQSTNASISALYIDKPEDLFFLADYYLEYGAPSFTSNGMEFKKIDLDSFDSSTTTSKIINGDNVIEKSQTVEFTSPNSQPPHLSYFCICTMDRDALEEEFDLTSQEVTNIFTNLNSSESLSDFFEGSNIVVIDGGATSYTENGFFDENGKKWEGPVHLHNGEWVAGKKHISSPFPEGPVLTKKLISSPGVIKDFRDFTDLPLNKEEFYRSQNILTNFFGTQYEKKLIAETNKLKQGILSFDIITHDPPVRDSNTKEHLSNVGIFLALDAEKLANQYAYINTETSDIKSIDLFRKNVITKEPPIKVSSTTKIIELAGIDNKKYKFFQLADKVSPGDYEYYAEIELDMEKHIKYVDDTISNLKQLIKLLGEYYEIVSGVFSTDISSKDKKIGSLSFQEDFNLTINKKTPWFNSAAGKYLPGLEQLQNVKTRVETIKLFLSNERIAGIFGTFYPSEGSPKFNAINSAIDPVSGTPDGVLSVKKIFMQVLHDFEKIYGGKTTSTTYNQEHTQKSAAKTKGNERIRINLQSTLDLRNKMGFGYRFLEYPNQTNTSLVNYSKEEFNNIINERKYRFFSKSLLTDSGGELETVYGPFGNISDTLFSYIETHKIHTGLDQQLSSADVGAETEDVEKQEKCFLSILNYNLRNAEVKNNTILDTLFGRGISLQSMDITTPPETLSEIQDAIELDEGHKNNPDNYNGIKRFVTFKDKNVFFPLLKQTDKAFSELKSISFYDITDREIFYDFTGNSNDLIASTERIFASQQLPGAPDDIISDIKKHVIKQLEDEAGLEFDGHLISEALAPKAASILRKAPNQTKGLIMRTIKDNSNSAYVDSARMDAYNPAMNTAQVQKISGELPEGHDPTSAIPGQANFDLEIARENVKPTYIKHWFNFDNLARIEYLDTFDTSVGNPKWRTLEHLPGNTFRPEYLLCRLVKYENKLFNIRRPKVMELPIYNEYFLINLE